MICFGRVGSSDCCACLVPEAVAVPLVPLRRRWLRNIFVGVYWCRLGGHAVKVRGTTAVLMPRTVLVMVVLVECGVFCVLCCVICKRLVELSPVRRVNT